MSILSRVGDFIVEQVPDSRPLYYRSLRIWNIQLILESHQLQMKLIYWSDQ